MALVGLKKVSRRDLFLAGVGSLCLMGALFLWPVANGTAGGFKAAPYAWSKGYRTRVRLLASKALPEFGKHALVAGVHIKLDPGWKTYWRNPGESGVPPSFNWAGSTNVKSAKVLFPAPKRYKDPYSVSIGYKKEVVFPVIVEPKDPSKPVNLKLDLFYGVCKDVCVPADAKLRLELKRGISFIDPMLTAFLAKVPQSGKAAASHGDQAANMSHLKVQNVNAVLKGKKPHILIDAQFPENATGRDLFVEAPDGLYIPLATSIGKPRKGVVRYKIDLSSQDDVAALKGRKLTFTLVCDEGQREVSLPL